jgi:hypothetical protein
MRNVLFVLIAITACKSEDNKPAPPPAAVEVERAPALPPKPMPKKVLTAAELGNCHLVASGAVTADQTTPGGRTAANVSYWLSEAERKNMMGIDGFVVNCQGPDIDFRLLPGGGKKDGMPFKPKKYEFKDGKGDANVMVMFGKKMLATPNGTIDIIGFDSHHIAGSVDISGKLTPGGGDVKITGSFDLVCPGFSGCDK